MIVIQPLLDALLYILYVVTHTPTSEINQGCVLSPYIDCLSASPWCYYFASLYVVRHTKGCAKATVPYRSSLGGLARASGSAFIAGITVPTSDLA